MNAPHDTLKRDGNLAHLRAAELPLVQRQLDQMLMLARLATVMWWVGQNQMSRYSTLLAGGVPIGA